MSANEEAAMSMIINTYNKEGVLSRNMYDTIAKMLGNPNHPMLKNLKVDQTK